MSELRAATISNLAGTGPVELTGQVASKSWVNFDGTGTVSIRESFNVSSITDNGTGDYTVNFAAAMVDANYAFSIQTKENSLEGYGQFSNGVSISSGSLRFTGARDGAGSLLDSGYNSVTIFR